MIRIRIILSGLLRKHYRMPPSSKGEAVELKSGACAADLLSRYGIVSDKVHMIVINRRKANLRTLLKDGDQVRFLPLTAGG